MIFFDRITEGKINLLIRAEAYIKLFKTVSFIFDPGFL